jgi:NAD(P)-dependent dehydrogenase (short-subunit alcohol dehydrogenase family)
MSQVVVITGSTRGIGYGLAQSFLARNCLVVVSGRSLESVTKAVDELSSQYDVNMILGYPCDVRDYHQVESLWQQVKEKTGKVDVWINNAGVSNDVHLIGELDPHQIEKVVATNLLGTIFGCQVAVNGMREQGFGSIYIMEGAGSDGRIHTTGLSVYGTSKYGLHYFSRALAKELTNSSIIVGSLRPGMVITELVTDQFKARPEDWEKSKKLFNIIADRVETVAPWLVDKILANQKSGVVISWSSNWKILKRFLGNIFRKRNIFDE